MLKKLGVTHKNKKPSKNKTYIQQNKEDDFLYPSTSFRNQSLTDPSGKYGSFKTDKPVKIVAHCTVAKKNLKNKKLIEVHPRIFYKIQW